MEVNIIDLFIVVFLILGGVVGYKNGAIKEGVKFGGFFVIILISFLLKDRLMVLFYENLPFFNFFGFIKGVDAINILFYQLLSFIVIFMSLFFILKVLVVITGLIEWIVKMTVFLNFPSKIIGLVVGVLEYYVYIFIALYVISIPIFNLSVVNDSKLANGILNNTLVLSGMVEDTVNVYSDVWDIIKDNDDSREINEMVLATLLDNKLITIESARELVNANKIILNNDDFLDNYVEDGDFYDKVKEVYYGN